MKYAKMDRTTFPLFLLTNWQHGASTGQGNTFVGRTLSDVAQNLVVYLSDECDVVLLLAGLPTECELAFNIPTTITGYDIYNHAGIVDVVKKCSINSRTVVSFVDQSTQKRILDYFHEDSKLN